MSRGDERQHPAFHAGLHYGPPYGFKGMAPRRSLEDDPYCSPAVFSFNGDYYSLSNLISLLEPPSQMDLRRASFTRASASPVRYR